MNSLHTPAEMFPYFPGAGRPREYRETGANWSGFNSIIQALEGKRNGSSAMVRCPAHDDRNPSLAVKLEGGKLLVHCHAGCSQTDVIAALKALGLWKAEPTTESRAKKDRRTLGISRGDDWPVTAVYDYTDAFGNALYQVRRHEPDGGGDKTFKAWRPDGRGGFVPRGPKDEEKALYRLPEVLEAPIVFLVAGEKDVETMRSHGFVATTNPFGEKQRWLPQYTAALAGREVIIIPDKDETGRAHALKVARALIGKVARLVILELDRGKDVTEWFDRGGSEVGLVNLLEVEQANQ